MTQMGRPRIDFDWELVDSLCMLEATEVFIAERLIFKDGEESDRLKINAKIALLKARIQERYSCTFLEYRKQKVENRILKLREAMWKGALSGNTTMQIWLSKNYLNMSDKAEIKSEQTISLDTDKFQFIEEKEVIEIEKQ